MRGCTVCFPRQGAGALNDVQPSSLKQAPKASMICRGWSSSASTFYALAEAGTIVSRSFACHGDACVVPTHSARVA
jgi:hypothetical protein